LCESIAANEQNTGSQMKILKPVRNITKSRYERRRVSLPSAWNSFIFAVRIFMICDIGGFLKTVYKIQ
jgi:hypothetical protein